MHAIRRTDTTIVMDSQFQEGEFSEEPTFFVSRHPAVRVHTLALFEGNTFLNLIIFPMIAVFHSDK